MSPRGQAARAGAGLAAEPATLPGVGPARARLFERLGVRSVRDLLLFVPRRLTQRGAPQPIARVHALAPGTVVEELSLQGSLAPPRFVRSGRRSLLRARLSDGEAAIDLLFFNQPWQRQRLVALAAGGVPIECAGRLVWTRGGPALAAPRLGTPEKPLEPASAWRCVYPTTEGLGQATVRGAVAAAVARHADELVEPLAAADLARLELLPLPQAVRELHAPTGADAFRAARRRVMLEPALELAARLAARRADPAPKARALALGAGELERLFALFGFEPTAAQRRALAEIAADLGGAAPMRRLLQGDVGSGKTAVGVAALFAVARAGGQGALLAPTEILAEQHFELVRPLCARAGIAPALFSGGWSARERRERLAELREGKIGLAVGTHALLGVDVHFHRLDLAVIDEQQRFGVAQRRALLGKGEDAHMLLMTATPIPRTLALTLYGDLATSLLDERPPGRQPVATEVLAPEARDEVLARLEQRLGAGERAFWVAPRILAEGDEGEEEDPRAVEEIHRRLAARLSTWGVELVHGRVAREERAERLERFKSGRSRLLVGTTVIEVGLDVPEATLLVVDGAESFGLAQLHQLRGRVGRGNLAATCLLIAQGEGAERCRVLARESDGFAIAEEDLRRRGMGELAGLRQSGEGGLGGAEEDLELFLFARDALADARVRACYAGSGAGDCPPDPTAS
jgi:ATP-dependent DNA helicase RecG